MRKKMIVAACGVAIAVGFSACDKKEPGYSSNETVNFGTYNIVAAEGEAPYVAPVRYQYNNHVDIGAQTQTMAMFINDMKVNKDDKVSFKTMALPYKSGSVRIGESDYACIFMSGSDVTGNEKTSVKDFDCLLTYAAYMPSAEIPGYPVSVPKNDKITDPARQREYYTVMSYKLDDKWRVRTFWPDVTFKGTTTTSYPGMDKSFTSDKIEYRVVLDLKKEGAPKADVFLINACFAPNMPKLKLALRGLPVTFNENGYVIEVTDVNPELIEGEDFTENRGFPFDRFSMTFDAEKCSADIEYKVKKVFDGKFNGNYILMLEEGAEQK